MLWMDIIHIYIYIYIYMIIIEQISHLTKTQGRSNQAGMIL